MSKGCELNQDGDWAVLRVWGEVDLSWSQDVRRHVLDGYAKAKALAVQLDGVSYIDSSGIAALVEGFQQARSKGGKFALLAPSESVRAVLELARLDRIFPIYADLAAARAG
jgi:anti-sigma B factor antagonist